MVYVIFNFIFYYIIDCILYIYIYVYIEKRERDVEKDFNIDM
jgi:hypothetical protein